MEDSRAEARWNFNTHRCFKKSDRFKGRWERELLFLTLEKTTEWLSTWTHHLYLPPLFGDSHTQPCHHKGRLNTHLHTLWHRDMTDADQPEQMQPWPVCDMETRQHRYKKNLLPLYFFPPTFWNIFNVILDFKRKPKKTFPCGNRNKLLF